MNNHKTLEFNKILEQLADNALSAIVKARCLALVPSLNEAEVRRRLDETTQAKRIIEQTGIPPLPSMTDLQKVIGLIAIDVMLMPDQIAHVSSFLVSCRRMKAYLKKAETTDTNIAWYGGSINELSELENEIDRCIKNGVVDDKASTRLADIRRLTGTTSDQIKVKLDALLRKNKDWFSESFVSIRSGRYTLPVKREHKKDVIGSVVDLSQTGGTCFIEPASVGKLQSELSALQIEEDSEVRRILHSLTALISDSLPAIRLNIETMETLDFIFAKGKLSLAMKASPVIINAEREIRIMGARHPLINPGSAVPLNFEVGYKTNGVVITGPNTGGKTVALKSVGLLSLMVQSGLHVPADKNSIFCMRNLVLCDIGDGQSIAENLSTFSSHLKNIIEILKQANHESLVLLDELGSGTDPVEGMGLAIAILDELSEKKCLFVVTTHYPEIKEYAANKPGLVNARMAFDKESLLPLYRLEIGEAGESCAFYIAERLGMQQHLLIRAHKAAYGSSIEKHGVAIQPSNTFPDRTAIMPQIVKEKEQLQKTQVRSEKFNIGDSVIVYPQREKGIVYARSNDKGEIGVQIKGEKKLINHKRIKLKVAASELYPDNYDFSIIFDSVANRKARHLMEKRHVKGNIIIIDEGDGK
jgi:DNA mismatch repair protein MutS2